MYPLLHVVTYMTRIDNTALLTPLIDCKGVCGSVDRVSDSRFRGREFELLAIFSNSSQLHIISKFFLLEIITYLRRTLMLFLLLFQFSFQRSGDGFLFSPVSLVATAGNHSFKPVRSPSPRSPLRSSMDVDIDLQCPICLELFNYPIILPCSHVFVPVTLRRASLRLQLYTLSGV